MKRGLALLALLLSVLFPGAALANAIKDVTLAADASDIVIAVSADAPLQAPTVRTYAGSIRVRFYDANEVTPAKVVGDGGAVRAVEIGRGSSDGTAALLVTLGDRTRLAPTDVRIEMKGTLTLLRIARGLLPAVRESPEDIAEAAIPPASTPLGAPAREAKPQASSAPTPAPLPKPAAPAPSAAAPQAPAPQAAAPVPAPAPVAAAREAPAPAPSAAPAPALGTKKAPASAADDKSEKLGTSSQSSPIPLLLAFTALLAGAYGGLRLFMQKKTAGKQIAAIDVIAQRQLGPRHQLVIVRAFNRDYLLSIQGGQTTVIARSSRRGAAPVAAVVPPELGGSVVPSTVETIPPSVSSKRVPPPMRDFEDDDEVTFGGELFKQALEQRERARENTSQYRLEAARAEARAEIARMESLRAAESTPSNSNRAPEEPTADGISESVSGLLRLRRESGK